MNAIKKFFQPFLNPPQPHGAYHEFSVRCKRCGEVIPGRINVNNDPSAEYDEKGNATYVCRKGLVGSGHCFQQIEVIFKFDLARRVIERQITGGEFVEG